MLNNRPAVIFSLPFVAGIIVGWQWDFSVWYVLAAAFLFLFSCAFVFAGGGISGKQTLSAFLLPLIFLVGLFKISVDKNPIERNHVERYLGSAEPVTVVAKVVERPRVRGTIVRFVGDGEWILSDDRQQPIEGSILVTISGPELHKDVLDSLRYGRRVELYGMLSHPGSARNPGEFDLRHYLRLHGIHARLLVTDIADISLLDDRGSWFFSSLVHPLRERISSLFDRAIDGEEAMLLKGLTIGDRSEIPNEVKTSFVNAGVMHILAVSGLHVGLLTLIVLAVLAGLRVPERGRIVATCVFLLFYVFLTGAPPSVVRAVTMAIVVLCAKLFERKTDVVNSLAAAGILMLMYDARQLFMPGFQLSYAAVLSIVLLYPRFNAAARQLPKNLRDVPLVKGLAALASVSLAAAIGTLPFTSLYFGKISVIGLAANLVIVPLTGIVLALGFATIAASFVWESLASLYAESARLVSYILLTLVKFFGNLSFSHIDTHFTPAAMMIFYVLLGVFLRLKRQGLAKQTLMVALIALNVVLYAWVFGLLGPSKDLRVTFLDVGQGDAVFIEFPSGENMLVDAGPRTFHSDAGAAIVAPFLKRKGISQIDAVVVSHPHSDHLGGIPTLLRQFRVGRIYDAGSLVSSALFREYRAVIDSLGLLYSVVNAGERIEGFSDSRLYVVHPYGSFAIPDSAKKVNLNNQSVVLRILYGRTSLLLAGDAEASAEEHVVRCYGSFLASDLLKIGHHGSLTSSSEEFLDAVDPSMAVISVGRKNKFHHPSDVVLQRLEVRRVRTFRSDVHNAAIFVSNGERWRVEDWR